MSEDRGQLLTYVKTDEVRLVRKKHRIGFWSDGTYAVTVADLVEKLCRVPSRATVDEVVIHEDDSGRNAICTIEFHEELVEG